MSYTRKKLIGDSIPLVLTAIAVTVAGIISHQTAFRILPLYNSIIVSILQSKVNRYASLIGGINSLLYAYVDWHYGLYATCASDLLVSFPFQIATFILWSRRAYKHTTMLRSMTNRQRILVAAGCAAIWVATFLVLRLLHSNYQFVDSSMTLMGLLLYVLTLFAFVEYTWLMIPNCLLGIILNVVVMLDSPDRLPFLVFSIYSFYCNFLGFLHARALYAEQRKAAS